MTSRTRSRVPAFAGWSSLLRCVSLFALLFVLLPASARAESLAGLQQAT